MLKLEKMSATEYVQIKDIKAGMRNINAVFIVLEVGQPILTKQGHEIRILRVADPTAMINFSVWDEAGALLQPGDIVRLTRGYAALWRCSLTLYTGKYGDIQKVDEFCMVFNEELNMSEPQPALAAMSQGQQHSHAAPLSLMPNAASDQVNNSKQDPFDSQQKHKSYM